ncbi:MAG: hypothetical protein K0S01_1813 [Herbinix sp.]|jgi:stage II sporulation protein R|nr:hypothetical protein [Herbinix sp.]
MRKINTISEAKTPNQINTKKIQPSEGTPANSAESTPTFLHKRISDDALDKLLKYLQNDNLHSKNKRKKNTYSRFEINEPLYSNVASKSKKAPNKGQFQGLFLLFLLVFSGITMWLLKTNAVHSTAADLQTGIAEDIIRFHVIANSDSESDQALKLTVKDTLVANLSPYLRNADTIEQARTILSDKLAYIQKLAEDTIKQNGYSYPVKVSLADTYFPLKVYGDYSFPPGTYEALRVQIGEAEGKNWWCVMFPPLCFVDETYSVVDESSKEKLKHLLTEEEYDTLISKKTPVKIKFKLIEAVKDIFR